MGVYVTLIRCVPSVRQLLTTRTYASMIPTALLSNNTRWTECVLNTLVIPPNDTEMLIELS